MDNQTFFPLQNWVDIWPLKCGPKLEPLDVLYFTPLEKYSVIRSVLEKITMCLAHSRPPIICRIVIRGWELHQIGDSFSGVTLISWPRLLLKFPTYVHRMTKFQQTSVDWNYYYFSTFHKVRLLLLEKRIFVLKIMWSQIITFSLKSKINKHNSFGFDKMFWKRSSLVFSFRL